VTDRDAFKPLDTGKEIVLYRGGWGLSLPDQHTVRVNTKDGLVSIRMPQRGGTYSLEQIEETEDELRVHVARGEPIVSSALGNLETGYPFPTIDVEIDRLRARWDAAGGARYEDRIHGDPGTRQKFEAWGQGEGYDEHTTQMRAMVRELERANAG
jgi:hypothetical protein